MSSVAMPPGAGAAVHPLQRLPVTLQPHPNLLKYYMLTALLFGPAFLFAAPALYFRYRTLRYDIDDEGITMRWGILFRREISLTYARIQDIQLESNVVQRWLGLARIQLQTASGSASAEMAIEGIRDVDAMRDFLYSRMRGATGSPRPHTPPAVGPPATAISAQDVPYTTDLSSAANATDIAELTAALDAVAAELRALRLGLSATDRSGHDRD